MSTREHLQAIAAATAGARDDLHHGRFPTDALGLAIAMDATLERIQRLALRAAGELDDGPTPP